MVELQISSFVHPPGSLSVQMQHSDGTAEMLVKKGSFGADLIRFAPGTGVRTHTHVGDHVLVVISGDGHLTFGDQRHRLSPGTIYLVPGSVPHAIDAMTELSIIAIGNDHRDAGSVDRLEVVP